MATLQQQVQQAQATLQMVERMVKVGRASVQEVTAARERLAGLQAPVVPERAARSVVVPAEQIEPEPTGRRVDQEEYLALQAEMSLEADRLNRQMAELSNQLHKVPVGSTCAELTRPILAIKEQIETIWDKKRYLERNRCLPDEPDDTIEPEETSVRKFELAYQKRRLVDLRSKLKKKLENPMAKPTKKLAWEAELAETNLEIQEIDFKLGTL